MPSRPITPRRLAVLRTVRAHDGISVAGLCWIFEFGDSTIRRELWALERAGQVRARLQGLTKLWDATHERDHR